MYEAGPTPVTVNMKDELGLLFTLERLVSAIGTSLARLAGQATQRGIPSCNLSAMIFAKMDIPNGVGCMASL